MRPFFVALCLCVHSLVLPMPFVVTVVVVASVVVASVVVVSVVVVSVVVVSVVPMPLLCVKVFTFETRPLNSVDGIFALAVFTQPVNFVPLEDGRKGLIPDSGQRSAVSRSPEPVAALKIVVAAAAEEDVIGNANRNIDAGI